MRFALTALLFTTCLADAADRPNVLLVITDDQGYGDFSIHGNPHVKTPHIDKLGEEGVRFERFYVNSFCAPTRAALLTGRWPLRTGCFGVTHNKEAIRPSEVTIAEALKAAGYRTACIGKWHNGEQYPFNPTGQGFDEFFGFTNGHWNNYFDAILLRGTSPEQTTGYITDVLTDDAIRFISEERDEPFFCYVSYNCPHSPYQVADEYFDRFKGKGFDDNVTAFYGMCENIDDNVGRLLKTLSDRKLADNTIVMFMTDNGGTAGVRIYNAGMRGGKTSVHEGGSRVPLFVRWPAAKWVPHVASPLTSHIDILPTLIDLCGVKNATLPNAIDGVSLRSLLENTKTQWQERVLFTHNPIDESNRYPGAVRTEKHRLVCNVKGRSGGSSAVNIDKLKRPWMLFDMHADPGEKKNIADKHPELVKSLSERYEAWYDDISSAGLQRMPLDVGHKEHNPVKLNAPQAFPDKPLKFANGPGFANDWLTNWTAPQASIRFQLNVVTAGVYDVSIEYACPNSDAGSVVRLTAGTESKDFNVSPGDAPSIQLPHREQRSKERYRNRKWATLKIGPIKLTKGPTTLTLTPVRMPGDQVMEFKSVTLAR